MFSRHSLYGIAALGLVLFAGSLFLGRATKSVYFHIGFLVGLFMVLEAIIYLIHQQSHFSLWHNTRRLLLTWALGVFTGTIIFDIPGVSLGLWTYPVFHDLFQYSTIGAFGWGLFFINFYDMYRLFDFALDRNRHILGLRNTEEYTAIFFSYVGILGVIVIIVSYALIVVGINPFAAAFGAAFGVWFVFENIEFSYTKKTLLTGILHGDFHTLLAVFLGAITIGFLSEFMNVPMQNWVYYHVLWPDISVAGVPLFILVSWVWMYILFLSLYNIVYRGDKDLWK